MFTHVLREVAIVSQLCISFPYVLHGLCEDYLTCDIAFNAVMPLSRASTRGRYSRIEGVTTRTRIERRREARRQSDQRNGPTVDMHALGEPGELPYAVGCPAFTRELRQVQWPSTKNFKPDVQEKYDSKTHPSEFLSIY